MRSHVAVALIVVGGLLMIIPVIANAYLKAHNADHIAEFYSRNSSAIGLPASMEASFGAYEWACLLAGVAMVVTGVGYARSIPFGLKETIALK